MDVDPHQRALDNIAAAMKNPAAAEELDIAGGCFATFPREILELTNLRRLNASWLFGWDATDPTFPPDIARWTRLEELNLNFCQATRLPDELGELRALRTLHLQQSRFGSLPVTIGNLAELEMLDMLGGIVEELPASIGSLGKLRRLASTSVRRVPASLWSLSALRDLSFQKELVDPPSGLGKLEGLETLMMPAPTIARYASELHQLRALRTLRVWWPDDQQARATLPPEVADLPALTHLDVSCVRLDALPDSLRRLHHLEVLDVRSNALPTLEWLVRALPRLKKVRFSENKIKPKERALIDELMRLPPEQRATANVVPVKRPKPDVKALGQAVSINASITLVLGDAKVTTAWKGVGEDGPTEGAEPKTDWDRLHGALFPDAGHGEWQKTAELAIGDGTVLGVTLFDEGSGFAHVYRTGDRFVIAEGAFEDEKDLEFLHWIASPPTSEARDVGAVDVGSGVLAVLDSTEDGPQVKRALKKPPADGKAKKFGDDITSLLVSAPSGRYRVLLEPKVEGSWGRAVRCLLVREG